MIKFELPYNFNFDGKYFTLLDLRKEYFNNIDCIYMSAFENKIVNTRREDLLFPKTEDDYYKHILEFQKRNININILMQKNATLDIIEKYYHKYNIKDFTINDNVLASKIKEKYPNITLRLSITAKASVKDINDKAFDVYDNIVLFFWYNRHLDVIKQLPKKHKYTILCNTRCMYNCPYCDEHWFGDSRKAAEKCFDKRFVLGHILNFPNIAYIRPVDLIYFKDYISVFKLEGREASSNFIFSNFDKYLLSKETTIPLYNFNKNIILNYNKQYE